MALMNTVMKLGFHKGEEILDMLSEYQFLINNYAPYS
jgi:hypothetical protein